MKLGKSKRRSWVPEPKQRETRPKANQDFYKSNKWRKYRNAFMQENPICKHCEENDGIVVPATHCDHILAIEDGGDKWDWNNLQALCSSCHSKKTRKEVSARKNLNNY